MEGHCITKNMEYYKLLALRTQNALLTAYPLFDRHVASAGLDLKQTLIIIRLAITATYGFHSIRAFLPGLTDTLSRVVRLHLAFRVFCTRRKFTWVCKDIDKVVLDRTFPWGGGGGGGVKRRYFRSSIGTLFSSRERYPYEFTFRFFDYILNVQNC